MAILNSIRKRGIFLILIIAMALFAFILSDILVSGGGGMTAPTNIATINGVDIPRESFMREVEATQRNTNANTTLAMNRVWEQELRRVLIEEQAEKVGIRAERGQLNTAMRTALANNPTFTNEAGVVDNARIQEYIATIKTSSPQMYMDWIRFEEALELNIKEDIYFNMIRGGIRASQLEGEYAHHFDNDNINFSYVSVPYSSIPDEEISVTTKEIEAYIKARPKQFETEATADFEYVHFVEEPSEEDIEEARTQIAALLENRVEYNVATKTNDTLLSFKEIENYEDFVNLHSDVGYTDRWLFENQLPNSVASDLIALEEGNVYGPYKEGNTFNITRIIDTKYMPDSTESKHILIRYAGTLRAGADITRTQEEASKLADSIYSVVRRTPSKFEELAQEFSDDPSKNNGGDLGITTPGRMVPPFDEFIFNNPEGAIGLVETDFGFHIIQVGEQSEPKKAVKLATITQSIEVSENTMNTLFAEATKFEVAVADGDFGQLAEAQNLEIRPVNKISPMEATIPGIGPNREIVSWAFNKDTKVGDIKRFSISDGYVIAQLTRKNKKGLLSASDAESTVKPILIKEKKAQKIREKIAGMSMEDIASSQNTNIRSATNINMSRPTFDSVTEPKVVGAAFGTKTGETSGLIDGREGVYMVRVNSLTPAPNLDNYRSQAQQISQQQRGQANNKALDAIKNKAKIKDNRAEFY